MEEKKLPAAIVVAEGMLHTDDAKTAHGLIRGTDRFRIVAVIDSGFAGLDAGEVLDDTKRNIPVLGSVEEAIKSFPTIEYCIIGVATVGGILPPLFLNIIRKCMENGISIVNGLHDYLNDRADLVALAEKHGVTLTDIRKPKRREDLHFWSAEIFSVTAPVIAVLGTDCALGKRTTCRLLREACNKKGIHAEMIYTGQTGWLQGGQYGFIFDSTLNDFISGEIEHAIVSCWKETNADLILIEGQSALRNPSGPCGSEFIVSGNAKKVVLVHAPKRLHFDYLPEWGHIPSVRSEVELIKAYGAEVIALALNTAHCTEEEKRLFQKAYAKELNIPVLLPLEDGVDDLLPLLQELINK
jgi:uncharacterized NAD-dependent epimerase/dehydratase family protein